MRFAGEGAPRHILLMLRHVFRGQGVIAGALLAKQLSCYP